MHRGQEGPGAESTTPEPVTATTGREASAALPSAGTVARTHGPVSGWSTRRRLLAVGSAVGGAGLIVFGILTTGPSGQTANADGPVTTYADRVDPSRSPEGTTAPTPLPVDPTSAAPTPRTDAVTPAPRADPSRPGASTPGAPEPGNPSTAPSTGSPGAGSPGEGDPGSGTPGTPSTPDPEPTTPAAPAALSFSGLTKNFTVDLLGVKVLGSYTLSLAGQPGSTASVTYGGRSAGSVTFDEAGRGSLTLGRALVDLGLSDPVIRVAYSDGTAGSPIEASRNSL